MLLVCVNTFYRRLRQWSYLVLLSAIAFLAGLFINPPYRFAPEDNLAYRDVILFISQPSGRSLHIIPMRPC